MWDSAAFSSIFLASGFSCSQTESTPAHTQVTQTVGCFVAKINSNMKQKILNLNFTSLITNKKTYYIFLFVYFCLPIAPNSLPLFSLQYIVWFLALPIILLSLVVVGVWGIKEIWQAKASKTQPAAKYIFFAQISVIGLLWFAVSYMLAGEIQFRYNHQKFNPEIWQDPSSAAFVPDELTPRQRMLDDLIENILPGSNKDEIEALLGKSLNTGYFSKSERDLIYILGPERSFIAIDSEWLLIWLDDSGNFERYEIATD